MNEIENKISLTGDKFMLEIHLRQTGFTYRACGPFSKSKGRIPKFKEAGDLRNIYQNELHKACFQHDMAYGDFKDLTRGIADKILRDKAFSIAKNPKYDGYENGLVSMIYNFFDEKSSGSDIENEKMLKKELAELHKQII